MRHLFVAVLTAFVSIPAIATPTGVYFFGDSLTDVGNVTAVYATVPHPPGAPATIPGAPYDPEGRASNGPIYADVVAAGLGTGFSATPSVLGGNDFAFGGARTRYQIFGAPFKGILDQVASFTARPGPADSSALYVLWGGSNNLQDIILGKTSDVNGNPIPTVGQTISDLASAIGALYADGARKIFVPNVPDLALVPRVREFGPAAQAGAHALSVAFNAGLASTLAALEAGLSGLDIIDFDTYANLNEVIAHKSLYGFTNTTSRCYTGDDTGFTGGGTVCANPDEYLFWDGIHPTSALHTLLGERMLARIPEPTTLLLMTLALGISCRVRARR
ncbi:SGNH/GDSL hydrolase family protein [Accumulibacter sp.]|uniref:SGNH/GDSL hydrolase family protein n=1 Tax=Accumulibacter sp. TaxID=2053492 RepID=UPI002621E454|nr:SGNH/GDSL hydrolase family protein [Accumulibacter sp.]